MIAMLILDSYGLREHSDRIIECRTLLRMMQFKGPPNGEFPPALFAHTDELFCTLLCEDQVSRLEVESVERQWIKLLPSPNSFIFIVGDALMAWRNGRLRTVRHCVMMNEDKHRFSLGAFAVPAEGTIIKPQKGLVDDHHPQLLKEFDYMDFIKFSSSKEGRAIDSAEQVFPCSGNHKL